MSLNICTPRARTATDGDCQAQTAQLVAALGQRSVVEVLDWDRIQDELWVESYRRDLWGAAYLINGGCSDDGFDYFRGWLLGQGQAIWQAALADPDSLADHPQVRVHRPYQEPYYCRILALCGGRSSRNARPLRILGFWEVRCLSPILTG